MGSFLGAVVDLEETAEVLAVFDRVVAFPLTSSPQDLLARLYQVGVGFLLRRLGAPRSPGAEAREWRPLFRFFQEADPFYLTDGQVGEMLARCPPLSPEGGGRLQVFLLGFASLARERFPADFPSPLVSQADCRRWCGLFAPEEHWECLHLLHQAGLYPIGSAEGWRALHRWEHGVFSPSLEPQGVNQWQAQCAAAAAQHGTGGKVFSAHRMDFLAAVFGGAHGAMVRAGPCGEVPDCMECRLKPGCGWARGPAKRASTPGAVMGRLRFDRPAHLSTPQLLQGLFGLGEPERERLEEKLEETPLRRLAAKSARELEEWLEGTGLATDQARGLFEFGRRFSEERLVPGIPLHSAEAVFRHFRGRLRETKQEHFLTVLLDTRRCYLGEVLVTMGTLNQSPVHPREVFNEAIRERAASVLIVHNHPSGDPAPSADDIAVTRRLAEAGRVIGITLLDHIIIAEERYLSLLEQDMM